MYQKILVPLDGSEMAECVLPHVEAIARGCNAESVQFVRTADPVPSPTGGEELAFGADTWKQIEAENRATASKYLEQLVARVKYDGVKVGSEVLSGRTADSIADYADKNGVDLIIIATHGRSGVSRWVLGSVADRVLRAACVPVMMVRSPGCAPGI